MEGKQFDHVLLLLLSVFAHNVVGQVQSLPARQATCPLQPVGQGPMPIPDTAEAFNALQELSTSAMEVSVPTGYTQTFRDLNASCSNVLVALSLTRSNQVKTLTALNSGLGSVGYTLLTTYDTQACVSKCDETTGCVAANIYFERAPTVQIDPSIGCDNLDPPSTTLIKCAFWSNPINSTVTTDYGEVQYNFQVAIRGSNGYVKDAAVPSTMGTQDTTVTVSATSVTTSAKVSNTPATTASPVPTTFSSATPSMPPTTSRSMSSSTFGKIPVVVSYAAFIFLCTALLANP